MRLPVQTNAALNPIVMSLATVFIYSSEQCMGNSNLSLSVLLA